MPKHYAAAASLVALAVVLSACSSSSPDRPAGPGGGRGGGRGAGVAVPVLTAPVQQKTMPVMLPAVGTVEAVTSVQVRSQVTGQMVAIHFAEGQEVRKGQKLFSLDARPFQATLQQAEAVLARDSASLKNALAQQARAENLFKRGLIPREQYDTQQTTAAALTATVEADKASVENARLNLQYTEIKAPLTGRTGALGVHVGDLVRANDAAALVVINQLSPVYVTFSIPGRYLDEIRRHQRQKPLSVLASSASGTSAPAGMPGAGAPGTAVPAANAVADSSAPRTARGSVSFIDNTVDPTTGTIRLKGTFANATQDLWPGAFVQVTLELTQEADALVVPAPAVQASQDGQYVYVVKPDKTVEMRLVTIRRQQGNEMVIADGVKVGETVVTDGHLRLVPGARVTERGDAPEGGRGRSGTGR